MDGWLKAAQKHAAALAQDIATAVETVGGSKDGRRELEFVSPKLGFELDGTIVTSVDPEGQAWRLGVMVGDCLVAIDGFEVPQPNRDDAEEFRKAQATVRKWLKEMGRPALLAFRDPAAAGGPGEESGRAATVDEEEKVQAAASNAPSETLSAAPPPPEPRPSPRRSAPPESLPLDASDSGTADAGVAAAGSGQDSAEQLRVALAAEQEQVAQLRAEVLGLEGELEEARAECQELRHMAAEHDEGVGTAQSRQEVMLRSLQDQLREARAEAEASRRRAGELQSQAAALQGQNEELREVVARSEELAREAFEGREGVLEQEVARLRSSLSALEAADQRANEAEAAAEELRSSVAELTRERSSLQARITSVEAEADAAAHDLRGLREQYASELGKVREDHQSALRLLHQERAGREQAGREAEAARLEVQVLRQQVEASAGGDAEGPAPPEEGHSDDSGDEEMGAFPTAPDSPGAAAALQPAAASQEATGQSVAAVTDGGGAATHAGADSDRDVVVALHERIESLERRCITLQKKLNSRPIVFQAPKGSSQSRQRDGTPDWEPRLRAVVGPLVTSLVVRVCGAVDRALRSFTERLLRQDAWLWMFYAHLFLLYTIAASCYAQTESSSSQSPIDVVDKTLHQAAP